MYAAVLALHRIRVYLAHVARLVGLLQLSYVELPSGRIVLISDADPRIVRYYPAVNAQDGLIRPYPGHLRQNESEQHSSGSYSTDIFKL